MVVSEIAGCKYRFKYFITMYCFMKTAYEICLGRIGEDFKGKVFRFHDTEHGVLEFTYEGIENNRFRFSAKKGKKGITRYFSLDEELRELELK
jgi:hypothetical protein